ncbi:hypothetical protein Salat_1093000 [Sesamum alatum]|uniref:Uncharacterized protein n=1 Tax=Sesamum alatum TaxID=300844 RepID=A0AAE2CSW7_9LAMI|nr:hypothetical protein Salat_1093000 [Sesamum alatum]
MAQWEASYSETMHESEVIWKIDLEEEVENLPSTGNTDRNDVVESLENSAPNSPKYARMEDVKILLEDATERGGHAAFRWVGEQGVARARSPYPPEDPQPREQENSIGSSHDPQQQLPTPPPPPPQEAKQVPLEDPCIESLRKDIDELRRQLAPSPKEESPPYDADGKAGRRPREERAIRAGHKYH